MKTSTALASLIGGLLLTATALAQAPSSAPAGTTGLCKDGSFWSGPTKKGACHGHKGVQTWYAASGSAAAPAAAATPAPTHVYHCSGDRWYGKTQSGAYMTEAAAKAEGDRPDHGKACQ